MSITSIAGPIQIAVVAPVLRQHAILTMLEKGEVRLQKWSFSQEGLPGSKATRHPQTTPRVEHMPTSSL